MSYLYHGVPEKIEGDSLVPLNQMKVSHPELYQKYLEKYKGRESIMQKQIPLLDCLWNDVVQFMPVHPRKVFGLQKQLGLIRVVPPYKFFEVKMQSLDPNKTVVYFKFAPGVEHVEIKWLRDVDLTNLQEVPEATISYYRSLIGTGELPFNYQFIPHVLYKGEIKISDSAIITI